MDIFKIAKKKELSERREEEKKEEPRYTIDSQRRYTGRYTPDYTSSRSYAYKKGGEPCTKTDLATKMRTKKVLEAIRKYKRIDESKTEQNKEKKLKALSSVIEKCWRQSVNVNLLEEYEQREIFEESYMFYEIMHECGYDFEKGWSISHRSPAMIERYVKDLNLQNAAGTPIASTLSQREINLLIRDRGTLGLTQETINKTLHMIAIQSLPTMVIEAMVSFVKYGEVALTVEQLNIIWGTAKMGESEHDYEIPQDLLEIVDMVKNGTAGKKEDSEAIEPEKPDSKAQEEIDKLFEEAQKSL